MGSRSPEKKNQKKRAKSPPTWAKKNHVQFDFTKGKSALRPERGAHQPFM